MNITQKYRGYKLALETVWGGNQDLVAVYNSEDESEELKQCRSISEAMTYIDNREERLAKKEIKKPEQIEVYHMCNRKHYEILKTRGISRGRYTYSVHASTLDGKVTSPDKTDLYEKTEENKIILDQIVDTMELIEALNEISIMLKRKLIPLKFRG